MESQPAAGIVEHIKDIPIYRQSIAQRFFPILEKPAIALNFPHNWMTPRLAAALETGAAEYVLSTGTHHARMQIIGRRIFFCTPTIGYGASIPTFNSRGRNSVSA